MLHPMIWRYHQVKGSQEENIKNKRGFMKVKKECEKLMEIKEELEQYNESD